MSDSNILLVKHITVVKEFKLDARLTSFLLVVQFTTLCNEFISIIYLQVDLLGNV